MSPISYEELIELAWKAVEKGRDSYVDLGNNMDMCDALRNQRREFWKHWFIVSGYPLPLDVEDTIHFRCGC